jgi:hypothetical protein
VNLEQARDSYYEYSAKLSDINRQFCFAGIAIIWMFRAGTDSGGISFSPALINPLECLVYALCFDMIQYIWATIAWGVFSHRKEKAGIKKKQYFLAPDQINWPTIAFFWLKIVYCICGLSQIIGFLNGKI